MQNRRRRTITTERFNNFLGKLDIDNLSVYNDNNVMKTKEFKDFILDNYINSDFHMTINDIALQFCLRYEDVKNFIKKKGYEEMRLKKRNEKLKKMMKNPEYKISEIAIELSLTQLYVRKLTGLTETKRKEIFETCKTQEEIDEKFNEYFLKL